MQLRAKPREIRPDVSAWVGMVFAAASIVVAVTQAMDLLIIAALVEACLIKPVAWCPCCGLD